MKCPHCGKNSDQVINSREGDGAAFVRRRRLCKACGARFTTYERVEESSDLFVVKRDGRREPFDRAKIDRGLRSACQKRPIKNSEIEKIINEVVVVMERSKESEVSSAVIGEFIMARLKELDSIAYLRFASVYWAFDEPRQFVDEVKRLANRLRKS